MTSESIEFNRDANGEFHFAEGSLPYKTVIDTHALGHLWVKVCESRAAVEIMLDGRTVIYERVATDIHGHWICTLRIRPRDDDESD